MSAIVKGLLCVYEQDLPVHLAPLASGLVETDDEF
jgi:hypothetical protein